MNMKEGAVLILLVVLLKFGEVAPKHRVHTPCKPLSYKCAANFFITHGNCRKVKMNNLDTSKVKKFVIESLFFNATIIRKDMKISGLRRTQIKQLSVDKKDKLVILVTYFPKVTLSGTQTILFHDHGNPDVKAITKYKYNLEKVLVTTIFKGLKGLSWTKSRSFANIFKQPEYQINSFPDIVKYVKKYSIVRNTAEKVGAHPDIMAREEISVVGRVLAEAFFKKALCRK